MKKLNKELLRENVAKRAAEDIRTHHILGASVLVRQEGEVILHDHYGWADLARTRPLDDNCVFRIASMTKVVSAVAAMIVIDRGLIKLEDPVEKYLPEFAKLCHGSVDEKGNVIRGEKLKNPINIKHILTHTSLIDFGDTYTKQMEKFTDADRATLASALKFYSNLVMEKEPGVQNKYCTISFDLLSGVIEKVTGKEYSQFIREEITDPLKMPDTTYAPTPAQWDRMVEMHNKKDGVSVPGTMKNGCVFEKIPVTYPAGGAGMASTLLDYDRFAQMLLNGGILDGVRILSEESVRTMGSAAIPQLEGSSNRWGLGVRVIDNDQKILPIGCYGWSGAYGTHFWVDPENRITAVYMKNSQYDGGGGSQTAKNFERDVVSAMQ